MEVNESAARSWRSTQVYGLAGICLISGIIIGYIARASFQSNAVKSKGADSAVAQASNVKIPSGPMVQGLDQQIEPLLARLRNSPDDPSLLAEIGKTYYQARQFVMAAKYYEDSVRIKPDAVVLVKLGGAYHFGGNDDKAISAWNQALLLNPTNPDALFNIGFVKLREQGDRKGAIASWQKLLKTNPDHPKRAQVEALIEQARQNPEAPMVGKE